MTSKTASEKYCLVQYQFDNIYRMADTSHNTIHAQTLHNTLTSGLEDELVPLFDGFEHLAVNFLGA